MRAESTDSTVLTRDPLSSCIPSSVLKSDLGKMNTCQGWWHFCGSFLKKSPIHFHLAGPHLQSLLGKNKSQFMIP